VIIIKVGKYNCKNKKSFIHIKYNNKKDIIIHNIERTDTTKKHTRSDRCSGRVFEDLWNALKRISPLASEGSLSSCSCTNF
jgi:hypothetical protein